MTGNIDDVEKDIRDKLQGTIFSKVTHDKRVDQFVRLIVHYKLFHEEGTIFIDLNRRAALLLKPKKLRIPHFYQEYIPEFEICCIHQNEMIAEKIMAVCQRYKPRDYLDLYYIIKSGMPVSISLVKRKFRENGKTFSKKQIFKNSNRIFNEWNADISKLTKEKPSFEEVMQTLKTFFKYRNGKG